MNQPHSENRRVFLDIDSLTRWDNGIYQRFPQAEKVPIYGMEPGPRGSCDDALTSVWGSVLFENGLFRMWYWGQSRGRSHSDKPDRPRVCYAESDDGMHWRKPDLKIAGQRRYPGNNLLALPGVCMSVVRALPGTNAKYLSVCIVYEWSIEEDISDIPGNPHESGTHIFASDDGFHWRHVTMIMCHGDWSCLYADRATNRYLLYNKTGAMQGLISRRIGIGLESRDGVHWEGYDGIRKWRECFVTDDYDDEIALKRGFLISEYYGVGVYRVGDILVSVEDIFTVGSPLRPMFSQNPNGLCHFRLGFSHDGMIWRHPKGRPVWMELGGPGERDAGFMTPSNTFVEHGDDLLFYYGGSRYDHGWSINEDFTLKKEIPVEEEFDTCRVMMCRIKRDRFASLAHTYRGCFEVDAAQRKGDELFVNVACPHGQVRVAIAEKTDHYHGSQRKNDHLPGFSFDDCIPITGYHLRAPVRFRNARIADIAADKHLCLRFELTRAEIFAYEWGSNSG